MSSSRINISQLETEDKTNNSIVQCAIPLMVWLCVVLVVVVIVIYLVEFQLTCRPTNVILDYTLNAKNIKIRALAIGKTHLSRISKPLKRLAHWDVLAFDDNGNIYVVYSEKYNPVLGRGDTKKVRDDKHIMYTNGVIIKGNRSVFINELHDLTWKYTIERDRIYQPREPISLFDVAIAFNNRMFVKYNVVNNNCYHTARSVIREFTGYVCPNREFTLFNIMPDVPGAIKYWGTK